MARIPSYSAGTVAVTSAGVVTGTNTAWSSVDTIGVATGDIFVVPSGTGKGFGVIGAVGGDTSLTLDCWTGGTVSAGASYKIYRLMGLPSNAIVGAVQDVLAMGDTTKPWSVLSWLSGGIAKLFWDKDSGGTLAALKVRSTSGGATDNDYGVALTIDPTTRKLTIANPQIATNATLGMIKGGGDGFFIANDGTASGYSVGSGLAVANGVLNNTNGAGYNNRLWNPQFLVNQRSVSGTVTLAANEFGHDGCKGGASGCTYTFAQTGVDVTITVTAGSLIMPIEGLDIEGGEFTLSHAGTAQARVWQGNGTTGSGSYAAAPFQKALTANTQTNVEFSTGTILRPQLEPGSAATAFGRRPYSDMLAKCRTYYNVLGRSSSGSIMVQGIATAANQESSIMLAFPPMRAAPQVVVAGTWASSNITTAKPGAASVDIDGLYIAIISSGSGRFYSYNNGGGAKITLDAQLY